MLILGEQLTYLDNKIGVYNNIYVRILVSILYNIKKQVLLIIRADQMTQQQLTWRFDFIKYFKKFRKNRSYHSNFTKFSVNTGATINH